MDKLSSKLNYGYHDSNGNLSERSKSCSFANMLCQYNQVTSFSNYKFETNDRTVNFADQNPMNEYTSLDKLLLEKSGPNTPTSISINTYNPLADTVSEINNQILLSIYNKDKAR